MNTNFVAIEGHNKSSLVVSTSAAQTPALQKGIYDVWADVDVWIKVGIDASNVTSSNGYKIFAGNVVPVQVDSGRKIGAIAGGAGNLSYHRVG